ncbi:histidine phosphatase family protein, partial [bacterium]
TDIELSDAGREQMRRVGDALRGIEFGVVYTSPLRRSLESAEIVMAGRGPALTVEEGFREINFGDWEGWTLPEAAERDPENHKLWEKKTPDFGFPGGDTKIGFFTRIMESAREVFASPPLPALAVLHKGVIRGVLAELTALPIEEFMEAHIELGGIHRLRKTSGGGWELVISNETSHLGDTRIPESR